LSSALLSTIKTAVSATTRCLTATLVAASWIAISNHCVLAAVAPRVEPAQSACPFHSKPAKPQKQSAGTQCCKILRAIIKSPAKAPARAIVDVAHVDLALAGPIVPLPAKISLAGQQLDTGPPGKTSFVELIWSMRAHAPPALVT
jgi:hypothetical protein